jgi:hypothetical protein
MAGVETILGFRGAGKSRLARALTANDQRLVVVDSVAEYAQTGLLPEVDPDQLRTLMTSDNPYRCAIVPDDIEEVHWIENAIAARRDVTLVIDEIDVWYPSSVHPVGEGIFHIARYGRHYNQRLITVAREHRALHPCYRSQGILWVFPLRERGDVRYVEEVTGGRVDARSLRVLQTDGRHIIRTELARVDGTDVTICEFDLTNLKLYSSNSPAPE